MAALALLMLAAISLYRLPDFVMGPMANPFYHDIGLTKDLVGAVRGVDRFDRLASSVSQRAALLSLRFGYDARADRRRRSSGRRLSAHLQCWPRHDPSFGLFGGSWPWTISPSSFAGVALVSYMSSLTSLGYTATQYALLSSTYAWAGKILKGFSGAIVRGPERACRSDERLCPVFYGCRGDRDSRPGPVLRF